MFLHDPQKLNPYSYCRNNPLKYTDPTGMILTLTGDNDEDLKKAKQDIYEQVGEANKGRVSFGDGGVVSFDTKGLDLSKSEGASLINQLVSSKKNYGYGVGSVKGAVTEDFGIINRSETPHMSVLKKGQIPSGGFVKLAGTGGWKQGGEAIPRKNVVLHELSENYSRTDLKKFYQDLPLGATGAHIDAIDRTRNWGAQGLTVPPYADGPCIYVP